MFGTTSKDSLKNNKSEMQSNSTQGKGEQGRFTLSRFLACNHN